MNYQIEQTDMAGEETTNKDTTQSNVQQEYNAGRTGLNMDLSVNQIPKGALTYALNAALENFDSNSVNYQNEPGNDFCLNFPSGYQLIGEHFINEKGKHIFFLANSSTGDSEIGYMDNNDCIYHTFVNAKCLNFSIDHPIHKVVHRITNCTTEIYWTDGYNSRRWLDLENITSIYTIAPGTDVCDNETIPVIDCNKLKIQPNFNIPNLLVTDIITGGNLIAGTYQFAFQYSDSLGNGYTSYYSVTNPTPIADLSVITLDFNYSVGRSIVLDISNIDITGYYKYFNIAVIRTVNDITSYELVGTFFIDKSEKQITYTGQNATTIRLAEIDIFEKYPYYDIAQDVTSAQDILIWDNLTSIDRINYQQIANSISLQWQTYSIPANENYADELNATNLRGYLRDEVYAFEIVFLLRNGKQTDGFHIPGRARNYNEFSHPDISNLNPDFVGEPTYYQGGIGYSPYWKIYNTASVLGAASGPKIGNATPYQYGDFAYWESTELYPCNEAVWGDLANTPIRHHKFPDVSVSPVFDSAIVTGPIFTIQNENVFPIGVKLDVNEITRLIAVSNLTAEQKADIVGFKIVRGNRGTNKSIIAKGMLRNVGKYKREETEYYYPNYPYNDTKADPFIQSSNNAYYQGCETYRVDATSNGSFEYRDCLTAEIATMNVSAGVSYEVCSLSMPVLLLGTTASYVGLANYGVYRLTVGSPWSGAWFNYTDPRTPDTLSTIWVCAWPNACSSKSGIMSVTPPTKKTGAISYDIDLLYEVTSSKICNSSKTAPLEGFGTESKYRYVFNSPETSFGQPFLGNVLKIENVMFGGGKAHFVKVRNHAKYKLLTKEAQQDALEAAYKIGDFTSTFNASAMFAAYQSYLEIYVNGITRKNYTYSFNSIGSYDYNVSVDNGIGVKQRPLDIKAYLIPTFQSVGDNLSINNWNRETSVYLRTDVNVSPLPFAEKSPSMLLGGATYIASDDSRFTLSQRSANCENPSEKRDISVVSYYGSIKNIFVNQWGQMYSYETVDTGFQKIFNTGSSNETVFGGDTFITRFAYKTKLPFFIDNRVNAFDDSDVFYDEIGNIAYPKYWYSSRSVLENVQPGNGIFLPNFISYKAHNFDCPNKQEPKDNNPGRTYYDGKMYLFAYGIPNFYCETSYNVNLRQAFNNREGDFWPHVSTDIPDDWVQETFVPIAQDNTYYYNVTFSKQNKENYFSHLPVDWEQRLCYTHFPFRAIYSDPQDNNQDYTVNVINNWLVYRPLSKFDFPQNYGKLISLDGIQNKAVLARFENKTLLYNSLVTIDTSNPQSAYVGNSKFFSTSTPPVDFADTDLGYVGSQNKMLLKIPQGQITIDAKRGQVFIITGEGAKDITAFGSGMNRFFTDHLAFEILRYFPNVNTDNHFKGLGLHGVYDSKFDRVIITKLDYIPLQGKNIEYDAYTNTFYSVETIGTSTIRTQIDLSDPEWFCNKSWSLSYNFNTYTWVSFHSYIPNWYIAENNFFYSGLNESCDLEAIVANEIPYVPTTTTTSTRITTTTTTTTAIPSCTIIAGPITSLNCILEGFVLRETTTTTTSTSSTTTTTTTCMTCKTYSVTNDLAVANTIEWTACNGESQEVVFPGLTTSNMCACSDPSPVSGFTITYITDGCYTCFCYTVENTTASEQTINWADCEGNDTSIVIAASGIYGVCAQQNSVIAPEGVTVSGGTTPCSTDSECNAF
jgi:hypothetical protein